MSDPQLGSELPKLNLSHSDGGQLQMPQDLRDRWTLLYFYPKDDTPGCTKQACSYRDHISDFQTLGVQLYGVSMDDLNSHQSFKDKFNLNFPLLVDEGAALATALGVYGDQEWGGQVFKGLSRDTFLIGPDARVHRVWRKVNPLTTMAETYQTAQDLIQSAS